MISLTTYRKRHRQTKGKQMTDARAKMVAKIESQSTEQLLTIARMLNVSTDRAEMLVSIEIERVLEQRLPESEFIALMNEFEAELCAV